MRHHRVERPTLHQAGPECHRHPGAPRRRRELWIRHRRGDHAGGGRERVAQGGPRGDGPGREPGVDLGHRVPTGPSRRHDRHRRHRSRDRESGPRAAGGRRGRTDRGPRRRVVDRT